MGKILNLAPLKIPPADLTVDRWENYIKKRENMYLFTEQFVKQGVEGRVFADDGLHNLAVGADNDFRGEPGDTVVGGEVGAARVIDV